MALLPVCTTDSAVYCWCQDLCQLLNAEQPYWLVGMTEMTRTLCLELMEEVLSNYYSVFLQVCLLEHDDRFICTCAFLFYVGYIALHVVS